MPIFISYSHKNKDFAEKLARQLVHHNVHVWIDRWELSLGDSILDKIQEAVEGAAAILIVLSAASVESNWCKQELSAGLLRELEEKRVVVMPVLYEECKIPLFLRGKLFADFRSSFDDGFRIVMEGVAKVTNPTMSRNSDGNYHTDWSIDYGFAGGLAALKLNFIHHAYNQPYSCLLNIEILLSEEATKAYVKALKEERASETSLNVVAGLHDFLQHKEELKFTLSSAKELYENLFFTSSLDKLVYHARIGCRRLGEDTGKDVLVSVTSSIAMVYHHMSGVMR